MGIFGLPHSVEIVVIGGIAQQPRPRIARPRFKPQHDPPGQLEFANIAEGGTRPIRIDLNEPVFKPLAQGVFHRQLEPMQADAQRPGDQRSDHDQSQGQRPAIPPGPRRQEQP